MHQLFGRQATTTNSKAEVFPKVGSKEWKALFPAPFETLTKDAAKPAWIDALNQVKAQGLIPTNVPVGKFNATSGYPEYNGGQLDPKGDVVCSASYFCRGPDDVWDAPEGHVGLSFDDGPLPESSPLLYSFLKSQNQTATHFFIGSNILQNPDLFLEAFENGDDMACHTWSHPYMTTISDEAVVAELGWLLEIVRVSSGGRIPRYWRPPYGDVDNRVRAIAKYVFGLTTVIWNHDSLDWELPEGPVTSAGVHQNYTTWYSGPKAPGLVILSHELTTQSVQAFIETYPLIAQNGWIAKSIPDLFGGGWYVNARNDTSDVVSGIQVAQDGGTPVWSGYAEETASLGSTTRLTFTSTVVDGSTVPITAFPTSTGSSTLTVNGDSRRFSVSLSPALLAALLSFPVLACLL